LRKKRRAPFRVKGYPSIDLSLYINHILIAHRVVCVGAAPLDVVEGVLLRGRYYIYMVAIYLSIFLSIYLNQ